MKRLLFLIVTLNLCLWSSALYGQSHEFAKVWDGGLGGADPDGDGPLPPNLVRAWGMLGTTSDIDQDGDVEFISYDATLKRVFVWETTGDNAYEVAWHMAKDDPPGTSILKGSERSVMITDLDNDGKLELVQVWDAYHPDSTNGFNAMEIYEHDPLSGDFLPDTPTLTYDPPRDSEGFIRLEFMSQCTDIDGDGVKEIILTHRSGKNIRLAILSLPGADFASPDWVVEYVDSTTVADSTRYGMKIHSMSVGDLDGDGDMDMVCQMDGDFKPIIVYTATAANTYTSVMFDQTVYNYQAAGYSGAKYRGSAARLIIEDIDGDGTNEVYAAARGGKIWVVNGITDVATAFDSTNWTLIQDIPTFEGDDPNEVSVEMRGGLLGDADNNGANGFYFTARDPYESIYEMEWYGGVGGDVTDPDNYVTYDLYHEDRTDEITVGFVAMAIGDLDGDGDDKLDIVFTTGNGNEGVKPGIYMIEHVPPLAIGSSEAMPESFALRQNYPNPFNPATSIVYELSAAGDVKLVVYNILGQEVRTLFSGHKSMGRHEALWDGKDHEGKSMVSGIYYYTLKSSGFKETRKMLLLK